MTLNDDFYEKNTRLVYGLPAIKRNESWVVYSPYAQKMLLLNEADLCDEELLSVLKRKGMLGEPVNKSCVAPHSRTISLITTSNCNLRCVYCFTKGGDQRNNMPIDTAINCIKHVISTSHCDTLRLTYFGGEPTLNFPVIKASVLYAEQHVPHTSFHISTNGIVSTEVLDFLLGHGFTINVSMDGAPKYQDRLRPFPSGKKSSEKVEETIKYIVSKNGKLKIRLTVTAETVSTMPECVEYLGKLGAKYIHFEPVNLSGRAVEKGLEQPLVDDFIKYFTDALDIAKKYNVKVINSAYMNILEPTIHYCGAAAGDKIILGPKGDITLCYEVQDASHKQCDSFLLNKWNLDNTGSLMPKLSFDYNVEKLSKCKDCFGKYICSGGCPVRNLHGTNNFFTINDYYCSIKKGLLYDLINRVVSQNLVK